MNSEIQVHGILDNGQSCWKKSDMDFYRRYYTKDSNAPDSQFIVEIAKREDGGWSCYYSYLINHKVIAASNRDGSYFGITARVDDYVYDDVYFMYSLLDNFFWERIVGSVLEKKQNGGYQYLCGTFDSVNEELKSIEQSYRTIASNTWKQSNLKPIPSTWKSGGQQLQAHFSDVRGVSVAGNLLNGVKVLLSPSYVSRQSTELANKLQVLKEKSEIEIRLTKERCTQEKQQIEQRCAQEKKQVEDRCANEKAAMKKEVDQAKGEVQSQKADFDRRLDENSRTIRLEWEKQKADLESTINKLTIDKKTWKSQLDAADGELDRLKKENDSLKKENEQLRKQSSSEKPEMEQEKTLDKKQVKNASGQQMAGHFPKGGVPSDKGANPTGGTNCTCNIAGSAVCKKVNMPLVLTVLAACCFICSLVGVVVTANNVKKIPAAVVELLRDTIEETPDTIPFDTVNQRDSLIQINQNVGDSANKVGESAIKKVI